MFAITREQPMVHRRFAKARGPEELRKWVKSFNIGGVEFVGKMSQKMWANYGQHMGDLLMIRIETVVFLYSLVVWVRLGCLILRVDSHHASSVFVSLKSNVQHQRFIHF
jgi:hypothetical protein